MALQVGPEDGGQKHQGDRPEGQAADRGEILLALTGHDRLRLTAPTLPVRVLALCSTEANGGGCVSPAEGTPVLPANEVVDATALTVDHEPLAVEHPDDVATTAGTAALHEAAERLTEIGVWEIAPGVTHDVEMHEVLVVLAGHATVEFDDGHEVELRPGSVLRFAPGSATKWTVHERLRKVYFILDA